ncbi:S-adenosylmethionine:tRNA ribosyltransferase-isomerase [Deinococcus metallilatus]|uniref:S-adenosylmethionine:tRNA ribosyltransferase-isomerase n=1 Tax=Deinococcus metallilatus TaxID=1211322 RepID=A0AAJ5F1R5_9DEIO|nr:S-adenosylmethionine:tRNA ribosyltransferase-isomerase [Deinococcus metallilatus]MBB5297338.1 S-adenosylmethionine:tRNA ribosyltransferase-isomerase [Deinococcus metallilatus]QBY10115.1 S-adenosylmethionine:tRNA ribosyltransferase-isomerase [Deinococcus metallilatus]RXJ08275.1 S-adenosylmethionine:tRNA ribosyltransferase-isomerase [Deinococcus metallilatus]TLK21182.1 S-adenosylmethionine:tRNA ribosyltransferase-isomerase [Deinococcus metallilatus]GMA17097.1 queuosine biosynthesis protein [D
MTAAMNGPLEFTLPAHLEAHEPPEARGLPRDGVRLLVSRVADDVVQHATFRDLPAFLREGDALVINTSGTLPAALPARRADGTALELHLSTHLPADLWTVELRRPAGTATLPERHAHAGETLRLPDGGQVTLLTPYSTDRNREEQREGVRLWVAALHLPQPVLVYLAAHGKPIRYGYVPRDWPLQTYQTVFATEPGSAEMPSAGRPFTPELLTRLMAQGVRVAPLVLHTGVASLEDHEPPYEEAYRVPAATAHAVNEARAAGGRVIAVGTTVVRALETVTDERGITHPGSGWTREVITPERGTRAVHGLITGWHEPRASHLLMLEAIAGRRHLEVAYAAALAAGYLWHEFGDLHLILP